LQALKVRDPAALRSVLDTATKGGLRLPGLQAARAKLAEWEKARPHATEAVDLVLPTPPPAARPETAPMSSAEDTTDGEIKLRIRALLPTGLSKRIEVGPAENGAAILPFLLPIRGHDGEHLKNLRFFRAEDCGAGQIVCHRELELDRPLYTQGFRDSTLLYVTNVRARGADRTQDLFEDAMANMSGTSAALRPFRQKPPTAPCGVFGGAFSASSPSAAPCDALAPDQASDACSSLWQNAFKAVLEPFPPFSMVERLLGGGRKGDAVVIGWNAAQDAAVRGRCKDAAAATGAVHVVLTGAVEPLQSCDDYESFHAADADGHFGSEETEALLAHLKQSCGIMPPFLLCLVSRGYVSRRLAISMRQYLPESVPYFPSPPSDARAACLMEVPLFEARIFEEARRLHLLGAEFKPPCAQALDKLRVGWRERGACAEKPLQAGASTAWHTVFCCVCEPFPPFGEVSRLLECGGAAVAVGWNAAHDSTVLERCPKSVRALGKSAHLVLTGAASAGAPRNPELGPLVPGLPPGTKGSFFPLDVGATLGAVECAALLHHIEEAAELSPPFLLLVVSRGYLSRRLTCSFRQHLPPGVSYFPCPPADRDAACREEAPLFEARILEEARRLLELGVPPHAPGEEVRTVDTNALEVALSELM